MGRRPQNVEIFISLVSLLALLYLAITLSDQARSFEPYAASDVQMGLALTALCITAQTFSAKRFHRVVALCAQTGAYFALASVFDGRLIVEELVLLSVLVVQLSLRLSVIRGAIAIALVLACATMVGHDAQEGFVARLPVLVYGAIWGTVTECVMYYRERLVETSKTLALQTRSVENLVAANRSFLEHLENVKDRSAQEERFRITRELHDTIGYSMTNLSMMMNASRHLLREDPEKLLDFCNKSKELASSTLRETRQILYELRAIEREASHDPTDFFVRLCREFGDATGVETECHVGNLPHKMDERVFSTLFRTVQVGFINSLRHGRATHIRLAFWLSSGELRMTVWNNMEVDVEDTTTLTTGIGLNGVLERLESVGGRLKIGAVVDGFELEVEIPREELTRGTD